MATIRGDLATNLVAHWKLEESSGSRYDAHSNVITLTDNNTVASGTGKIGTCADFEAANTNEFLSATGTAVSPLEIGGDFTISMWVNFESTGLMWLIDKKNELNNNSSNYALYIDGSGNLVLRLNTGAINNYSGGGQVAWTPSTATWYHIAVTRDQSTGNIKFYVNGAQQGTTQAGTTASLATGSGEDFHLGLYKDQAGNYRAFDGLMDEVSIWDRELSSTDISTLYNSGSGIPYLDASDVANDTTLSTNLVSYWELETDGTDSVTGTGNDLTATGSPSHTTGSGGIQGEGVDLELSSTQYYSIADASQTNLEGHTDFSISLWYKPEAGSAAFKALASKSNGSNEMFIRANNTDPSTEIYMIVYDGSNYTAGNIGSGTLTNGSWFHIVLVFDGSASTIYPYVNGVQKTNVVGSATSFANNAGDFSIGAMDNGGSFVWPTDGVIDEVGFWSKALTKGEIDALYNAGSGIPYEEAGGGGTNMQINIGDSWKTVDAMKINIGDTWKDVAAVKINIGDTWKDVF